MNLSPEDREWIALTISDAASCRDTDDAARLIEARVETLIRRHVAAALTEAADAIEADGHPNPQTDLHRYARRFAAIVRAAINSITEVSR